MNDRTKPLHVVLAIRRFWPLIGGEQTAVSHLAAGLVARGARVTVLTFRWQADWPEQVEHRGARVVRLPPGLSGPWGLWRQMRTLAGWLRRHRAECDVACASALRHEACAVIRAADRVGFPVVLRAVDCGLTGDCHWQLDARCGQRIKRTCMRADALVASTSAIERELIAAGYARDRIQRIPCGVPTAAPRRPADRQSARRALAEAHPALGGREDAPVALFTGRLVAARGLDSLVTAWEAVVARRPTARLWLVGDGPESAALADQARQRGLAAAIAMPGAFNPVDDFLAAADIYVHPAVEDGTNMGIIEAMAAGTPVIASDIPGHRDLIEHERNGLLVPPEKPAALAEAVLRTFDDPGQAATWAAAARARAEREFTADRMVRQHVELFERLLSQRRGA